MTQRPRTDSEIIQLAAKKYFEEFADKVEHDTLTFKEGLAIFLIGGFIAELLALLSAILNA